jgi:hypothetical protein
MNDDTEDGCSGAYHALTNVGGAAIREFYRKQLEAIRNGQAPRLPDQ